MPYQYINGRLRNGSADETLELIDPSTGIQLDTVDVASADDVESALEAARSAYNSWSRVTPGERAGVLNKLAALLERDAEDLAQLESREAGKPIRLAREFDVPGTIDNTSFFAGTARNLEGKATGEYAAGTTSSIRREAVGVVGSIAPWNYPLQMAAWKVLPAIAAGNAIVLKPSELTPSTTLRFAQLATEAGLPDGIFNVVTGPGATTGATLIAHPQVDMVSFTGSTMVGQQIIAATAATSKRTHMELGGKAPFVVFDDADLEAAAHGAVAGSLINTGQDCTAATRAYVQRPLYDAFVAAVGELYDRVVLGPTDDPATDLGPLISHQHRDRVAAMVDAARAAGSTVVTGGFAPEGPGAYYRPTLITGAAQDSDIVQNEVFGPVLVVLTFDTDDEGLALANDSRFGLAASAWTTNVHRALRATRDIRAGAVWINDHIPIVSDMPHGGYKQSGYGKDMSQYALDEYTNVKHVMFDTTGDAHKDWHRTIFAMP
ncbi:gamma-aminobutyraldehyde dehydrogenase [Rudaeicoccus suwonensis]|uniref:Betaine-aldehyde dehydrogenase n=1 Tax=Rudaeicoccus suwonensis TaxID=657409 RepID=A0A561E4D1_9MICO|nr:gamma-aminobutyraldehyde dehydrogenase [Rudaeicoccus suwonensis]TWE10476.1 betaine-aldehyde dehydrogenase [Rudaeicoccus suwonensis]